MRARLQARRSLPWLWSAGCGFAAAVVLLGIARRTATLSPRCEGVAADSTSAAAAPRPERCSYGALPGRWQQTGTGTLQWQTFEPACQLTDQLTQYGMKLHADQAAPVTATRPVRILFYGDSVDRTMVGDVCSMGKGDWKECIVDQPKRDPYSFCVNMCLMPALEVARQHMWGVSPVGPYHQAKNGSPQDRVDHGWDMFVNETKHEPNMIVFASALWDIARLVEHFPDILKDRDDVPEPELSQYLNGTVDVLRMIEERATPGTLLVYHTSAQGAKLADDPKQHEHSPLGRHGHLVQLNAAGRQVAQERGWALIDFEQMAAWWANPRDYLRDTHHPADWFLNNVLNIYLNLFRDHENAAELD